MVSLTYAKLVATPTDAQWSQVYNAGNLFACLSLSKDPEDTQTQLNQTGKDMFSHLESEFFTLEDKNLQTIKEAIANSTHTIPSSVSANFCLGYFKGNILYLFIYGMGTIMMKRADKLGVLLEGKSESEIISSSGFLEQNDTIILQTPQFAKDIPMETLSSALELNLPNDIAEALSPAMHEKDDGGQAAIIISYKEPSLAQAETEKEEETISLQEPGGNSQEEDKPREFTAEITIEEEVEYAQPQPPEYSPHPVAKPALPKFRLPAFLTSLITKISKLDHRKKLFLSVAVLIAVVLVLSISFTQRQQEESKTTALFNKVYAPALDDYEEGLGVESINKEFARLDFLKSQKLLKENIGKFKKGSKEEKQISELLSKVEKELGGTTAANVIKTKEVDLNDNDLLSVEKENSDGIAFAVDKDSIDYITDKAVVAIDKAGKEKDVIKNDDDWDKAVGLSTYQGNIYILDQENGVLKYTAGSAGFGKSSYLKSKPSIISNAAAIAIDGSVWILFKDGSIMKYTRGESDGFKTKALDKPFKNPTKLATNIDTENLYVLDPGNSRIVKLDKDGNFQTQYNAGILKNAKDLEVSEKDGKITVLSGGKFWEIPL